MSRDVPLSRDGQLSATPVATVAAAVAATVTGLGDDDRGGLADGEVAGGDYGVVGGVDAGTDMAGGGRTDRRDCLLNGDSIGCDTNTPVAMSTAW